MERLTTEQIDKSLHRHGTYTYVQCSLLGTVFDEAGGAGAAVCSLLTMPRRICSSAFRGHHHLSHSSSSSNRLLLLAPLCRDHKRIPFR
jgi:hypothetical protein